MSAAEQMSNGNAGGAVERGVDDSRLYDRAPCGYLETDRDGAITYVNQTLLDWTGYEFADLVGHRSFADLLTGGGRIYHETHYAPMLQMQGEARQIALDIVCVDGRRLPTLVNSVIVSEPDGSRSTVRTAIFDATDRRLYERELVAAKNRAEESERRAQLLSRTLQQTLMPPVVPAVPGLDVAAVYRPAATGEEIGGDFYDVFQVGTDDWVVVIGDVQGKGVDAAVITALARHTIRAVAVEHAQPSQILNLLNQVLLANGTERFCTAAVMRFRRDDDRWSVRVSCGGHPRPLLRRAGEVIDIGGTGTLLGYYHDLVFVDDDIPLRTGDVVLAYTDGVSDARADGDFFGEHRVRRAFAAHEGAAADVAQHLLSKVLAFAPHGLRDDIAVVVVEVR